MYTLQTLSHSAKTSRTELMRQNSDSPTPNCAPRSLPNVRDHGDQPWLLLCGLLYRGIGKAIEYPYKAIINTFYSY